MGLAASQCRLLSLSSRLSDLESRSQFLSNQKVALSNASAAASSKYIQALNATQINLYTPNGEYLEATADNLTAKDAMTGNDQLFLQDDLGQVICSKDILNKFEAADGSLESFLAMFGTARSADAFVSARSSLLSSKIAEIEESSEKIDKAMYFTDDTNGLNADIKKATKAVKDMIGFNSDAPDGYVNSLKSISNTITAQAYELKPDENGSFDKYIDSETGMIDKKYTLGTPKREDLKIIADKVNSYIDENSLSNILLHNKYYFTEIKDTSNTSEYYATAKVDYYQADDVANVSGYVADNNKIANGATTGVNAYNVILNQYLNGVSGSTDCEISAGQFLLGVINEPNNNSSIYTVLNACEQAMVDKFEALGLDGFDLEQVTNAANMASIATSSKYIYDTPKFEIAPSGTSTIRKWYVNNLSGASQGIPYTTNPTPTAGAGGADYDYSSDKQGYFVYGTVQGNGYNTPVSSVVTYNDVISQYMAYFDAIMSGKVACDETNTKQTDMTVITSCTWGSEDYPDYKYDSDTGWTGIFGHLPTLDNSFDDHWGSEDQAYVDSLAPYGVYVNNKYTTRTSVSGWKGWVGKKKTNFWINLRQYTGYLTGQESKHVTILDYSKLQELNRYCSEGYYREVPSTIQIVYKTTEQGQIDYNNYQAALEAYNSAAALKAEYTNYNLYTITDGTCDFANDEASWTAENYYWESLFGTKNVGEPSPGGALDLIMHNVPLSDEQVQQLISEGWNVTANGSKSYLVADYESPNGVVKKTVVDSNHNPVTSYPTADGRYYIQLYNSDHNSVGATGQSTGYYSYVDVTEQVNQVMSPQPPRESDFISDPNATTFNDTVNVTVSNQEWVTTGSEGRGLYEQKYEQKFEDQLNAIIANLKSEYLDKLTADYEASEDQAKQNLKDNINQLDTIIKSLIKAANSVYGIEGNYSKSVQDLIKNIQDLASGDLTHAILEEINEKIQEIIELIGVNGEEECMYTDDASIQYYTNIFNMLTKYGASEVGDEKLEDPAWLNEQLKIGTLHTSVCDGNALERKQYSTSLPYLSVDSITDANLTHAQADYEAEVSRISKKEKKIDRELQLIETEHKAIQTETDQIKTNQKDNISRGFNLFT